MTEPRCTECGFQVPDGSAGCLAMFEQLIARDFSDFRYFPHHRLMVDVYAVQHPTQYCASVKSLMGHVGGLCCQFEYGGDPAIYRTFLRSLNGTLPIEKPPVPRFRGEITIAHVKDAPDPDSYARAIEEWARPAWQAYADLHSLAGNWIRAAIQAARR